jgi:N-methylhydantoinase A/oxoprolinase/acetone carboxylase beta subunit
MKYVIGIDVGGTNTDIVVIDENEQIVFSKKKLTTERASEGILALLLDIFKLYSINLIKRIVVGTTSSLNNILERKNLEGVGLIRLAKNSEDSIPPCFEWPEDLKQIILKKYVSCFGGFECDGKEIYPLNMDEIKRIGLEFFNQKIKRVVINSPFSHLFKDHEEKILKILEEFYDKKNIEISYDFNDLGIIERENTLLLNAALKESFFYEFSELKQISEEYKIPFYIVQNNGTLLAFDEAIKYPIKTIGAGIVNSCIGGSKLASKKNAVVVDVGGTSLDIGIVKNYFCKKSTGFLSIEGIKLLQDCPDIHSMALGGGTIIEKNNNDFQIGPKSIGKNLFSDGYSFGGNVKTLTDAAIVKNLFQNDKIKKKDAFLIEDVDFIFQKIFNKLILILKKINLDNDPVVLVGGASFLFNSNKLNNFIIPPFSQVANAYGAACAEFCTSVVTTKSVIDKEKILKELCDFAINETLIKGAKKARIIEQKMISYSYIPGNIFKIIIVAAGK